jgi:hypothetical protein
MDTNLYLRQLTTTQKRPTDPIGTVGPQMRWRRRTLPPDLPGSTIRAAGLNGRVRDGNECIPCAMATSNKQLG